MNDYLRVRISSRLIYIKILFLCLCLILQFSSCTKDSSKDSKRIITITDDLGREIHLRKIPQRIISLAPNITETLYVLDADSSIVGVTNYCDYPDKVRSKVHVGDLRNPSIETMIGLQPDLVIMTVEGNTEQTFRRLEDFNIPIFVTNPRTLDGVLKSIRDIGIAIHRESKAQHLTDSLKNFIRTLHHNTLSQITKVIMFVSFDPLMIVGKNTFIHEVINQAGGVNIGENVSGTYPTITREEVLKQNPDIILIPNDIPISIEQITAQFKEWEKLKAVRNNKIFYVDANILQRPGPRIFSGVALLRNIFTSD